LFNPFLYSQSLPLAEFRTEKFGRAIPQRCALTLIVNEVVCACTHYPVFKEPTRLRRASSLLCATPAWQAFARHSTSARIGISADRV